MPLVSEYTEYIAFTSYLIDVDFWKTPNRKFYSCKKSNYDGAMSKAKRRRLSQSGSYDPQDEQLAFVSTQYISWSTDYYIYYTCITAEAELVPRIYRGSCIACNGEGICGNQLEKWLSW